MRGVGRDRKLSSEVLLLKGHTEAYIYENEELILEVIKLLVGTILGFAECYLLVSARREKVGLLTFDRSLEKSYLTEK